MKGSAITGPVGKEAAELWPVSASMVSCISSLRGTNISVTAYRLQLWCCDVSGCLLREKVHSGGVRAAFYAQASSMISCHEGTSSQTIFFRRNKTPPQPCAWNSRTTTTTHDAKGPGTFQPLATFRLRGTVRPFLRKSLYSDARLGYRNLRSQRL